MLNNNLFSNYHCYSMYYGPLNVYKSENEHITIKMTQFYLENIFISDKSFYSFPERPSFGWKSESNSSFSLSVALSLNSPANAESVSIP